MKMEAVQAAKLQAPLYEEIAQKAKEYNIPADDAKIDKIWKAVPGYNGRIVDVQASYRNMEKQGVFDKNKLVFEEVPPKVHLQDLSPAPVYRGHPEKKMVALTINVAWGNEYLPNMLETLKKHNVKATFFLEGRWVKENPSLAKMIAEADQEVGNHSYTHPNMKTLSARAIEEQLTKTNAMIEVTTNQQVRWFAPPSGSFRDEVVTLAAKHGMGTIMWTVDTIDWQRPEPSVLLNRVLTKVHPGAIVLMHPTSPTARSLDTLIVQLKKKGYKIGSVSMLLDEKRID
ncbi:MULTISPECIES: polysaccharide deacetylase family protein [Bacillaceae]|jgi:probable sporulation protein (polysaccharide deacetylase family)|nr:polysaccharide deacetylase family protein [Ectobacillus funiculus]